MFEALAPVGALLLMGLVTTIILNSVVICDDMGLQIDGVWKRCIPHVPNVSPLPPLDHETVSQLNAQSFSELRGRLTWSISLLFFALAITMTLTAIIKTVFETCRSLELRPKAITILIVSSFLAVLVIGWFLAGGKTLDFNEKFLGSTVYKVAPAKPFVVGIEAMAFLALVGLAVSVSLLLAGSKRMNLKTPQFSVQARVAALAENQRKVRLLLYVGALALIAGTLEASALYTWAVSMLEITRYSHASDIPHTLGIVNGALYSILLAAIFVPAMIQLRVQARRLAEAANPDSSAAERNKWLDENAIAGTIPRQIYSTLAVAGPLLAGGPVVALLELIGS